MPIKPEDVNASDLPVARRGYQQEAVDQLLLRVAWDYRQALRALDDHAKSDEKQAERVAALEAQLAAATAELAATREQGAAARAEQRAQFEEDLRAQTEALQAEIRRLEEEVSGFSGREELTRTLLQAAQRSARELRESARQECEALLKAAHRRATEIEQEARTTLRHSTAEIDRLRRVEDDLREQLAKTLESVLRDVRPHHDADEAPVPTHAID